MTSLLPLEEFREVIGYHPFHFWGMADGDKLKVTSACNSLVRQHAWQDVDAVGRSEIAAAIETAEDRLAEYLGYNVAPRYEAVTLQWPRYFDRGYRRTSGVDADGRWLSLQLPKGKVQAIGVETLSLIGTATVGGGSLVFSDADGDGIQDTFTATLATTLTSDQASQLGAYFVSADRLDAEGVSERWRIRPAQASISGGIATLRGRLWLLVRPALYEGVASSVLNPATSSIFAQSLEVYRRTTNAEGETSSTSGGVLVWETSPCHGWWCCCGGCGGTSVTDPSNSPADPAAVAQAVARVGLRDAEAGIVSPAEAVRDATTGVWQAVAWDVCGDPDRAIVRCLSGEALDAGAQRVAERWRTVVSRLAAAELGRPICACDESNRELHRWQFDLARSSGAGDEAYGAISPNDLDNPFGTRRGHVYAWRQVKNLRQLRGLLAM